ncbi:MAG: hypothetical protein ACR2GU_16780 [Rubrobacteraceae bacterium]
MESEVIQFFGFLGVVGIVGLVWLWIVYLPGRTLERPQDWEWMGGKKSRKSRSKDSPKKDSRGEDEPPKSG